MDKWLIEEQLNFLITKGVLELNNVKQTRAALEEYWEDKSPIIWDADDVLNCEFTDDDGEMITAKDKFNLSRDEAIGILNCIEHDAGFGITWGTITKAITDFVKENERELQQ